MWTLYCVVRVVMMWTQDWVPPKSYWKLPTHLSLRCPNFSSVGKKSIFVIKCIALCMSNIKMRIAFTSNLALIIIYISHIHFNWTSLLIFVDIFWYVAHMELELKPKFADLMGQGGSICLGPLR